MIGEERLRDAARTIRRLEYELADARRDVQRANDRRGAVGGRGVAALTSRRVPVRQGSREGRRVTTKDPEIERLVDAIFRNDVPEIERLADSVIDRALCEAAWNGEGEDDG